MLVFSLLCFVGGAQAATSDLADVNYNVALKKAITDALAGNVEIAGAFASFAAAQVAEVKRNAFMHGAIDYLIPLLTSDDEDFKHIIPVISVAAAAGHTYALALVSYFTAQADAGDVNAGIIISLFANQGITATADVHALGDFNAVTSAATVEAVAALITEAKEGNVVAATIIAQEVEAVLCCYCARKSIENIATAAQAGDTKALSIIDYFTAAADAGDANAAAVVELFAAARAGMSTTNCC